MSIPSNYTAVIFLTPENVIQYLQLYGDFTEFNGIYINSEIPEHLDLTQEEYENKETELAELIERTLENHDEDNKLITLQEFKTLVSQGAYLIEIGWLDIDNYEEYLEKYTELNRALAELNNYPDEIDSNLLQQIAIRYNIPTDVLVEIYLGE